VIKMTLAEVAAAVGGRLDEHASTSELTAVTGPVVVDSRDVTPGALFVARQGDQQDGHTYARAAAHAGAVAVLAERPVGVPAVLTENSEHALGLLARHVASRLVAQGLTIVGITGSSGKTSTKDLLAQVLAPLGAIVAPKGSYNTEVGAPLTVLRADNGTRALVVEMGARGVGHIEYLCSIAPPHIGVVLNVGSAHVGEFGDRETTARAKGELVEALRDDGIAVLNADDPLVRAMADRIHAKVQAVFFGRSVHADIRAERVSLDDHGRASFDLVTPDGQAPTSLRFVGEHQVANALAVCAVATAMGMPVSDVAAGLSAATPQSRWRMEITTRPDGVTVINDAYNANPESARAALDALDHLGRSAGGPSRTWAVLGEMLELGERSRLEHEAIGHYAAHLGVAGIIAVGEGTREILLGAQNEPEWDGETEWVPDGVEALNVIRDRTNPGDVVLVKASRATGLEHLAEALAARGSTEEGANS
jgi:UDP-N-acetylmuramoyl-tripeptide--D-alanyl-D-alanine ligase